MMVKPMFQTFPKCGPGFGYLLGQDPFFWNVPTLELYPTHEMKALQVFPVFFLFSSVVVVVVVWNGHHGKKETKLEQVFMFDKALGHGL